jgi:Fe-S oxidoreductase
VIGTSNRGQFLEDFGSIQRHAKRCIHCGFCNAVCPTSNVSGAFKESRTSRGRVILIQSLVEGIGSIDPYSSDFKRLIDLCYSCRRCTSACPASIPIPDLMSEARYAHQMRGNSKALTLGHRIFANYGTFDRLGSAVGPISNWMLRRQAVRKVMEWATHIDSRANLPPFQRESFESWFKRHPQTPSPKKIVYYIDSYANFNNPSLGKAVCAMLNHMGYQVLFPPQKESAMPAIEYGLFDKARTLARYNIKHLAPYAREGIRILCSSPAASYLLREGYSTFLSDNELPFVSRSIVDAVELLSEEYENGTIQFKSSPRQRAKYHYCCLSQALRLGPVTSKLLSEAGLDYEQVDDCCGGAGVWGTFKENYQMSSEIAHKLRRKIKPDSRILTESETCKLQIEAHVSTNVEFPLEILAERIVGLKQNRNR